MIRKFTTLLLTFASLIAILGAPKQMMASEFHKAFRHSGVEIGDYRYDAVPPGNPNEPSQAVLTIEHTDPDGAKIGDVLRMTAIVFEHHSDMVECSAEMKLLNGSQQYHFVILGDQSIEFTCGAVDLTEHAKEKIRELAFLASIHEIS
jgi:hypothetical protein